MRVGLEREYGQKCVISYHVYMYIVSALDFAVVVFRLWFLQTQELGMLSLSPSLVLCICLLLTSFQALSFITRIVEKEQNVQWCSDIHQY